MFVENTGEKLVGEPFWHPPPPTPILNRVNTLVIENNY